MLVGNQTAVHRTVDLSSAWYGGVRCPDAKEELLNSDDAAQRFQLRLGTPANNTAGEQHMGA